MIKVLRPRGLFMKHANYSIENTIAMKAGYRNLLQQNDFKDSEIVRSLQSHSCHIYMICSRPKILFRKSSLHFGRDCYRVGYDYFKNGKEYSEEYNFPNTLGFSNYKLNEACNRIQIMDEKGKILTDGKSSLLYVSSIPEYKEILDLKILYIGQAFGENGKRLAAERLSSHSTLQQIYADFMDNNPNEEIWLILWEFAPYLISMLGSIGVDAIHDFDESVEQYQKVNDTPIPLDQQITVIEAALIKYFSPRYNIEYKSTFPASSHSSYQICYQLDFNNIAFELDTKSIYTRLYSDTIKPNFFHLSNFFLHSGTDRKNMFNIGDIFNI